MPKIHLLPEELINKIAAGEVIERPASVVKELIENSLDAHATKITVEIEEAGKKLLKIIDNGDGMDPEDAKNSLLRHATSKISSTEDLFAIHTLGFRGEALASIAAVSELTLTTKTKNSLEAFQLYAVGGNLQKTTIAASEPGTTIEVKNIFFNTPARKKFLKTDAVELRHILDIVTKYALINPKIAFRLLHNNQELLKTPTTSDLRSTIAAIYGTKLAKELLEVNYENENAKISGFISKPSDSRNDKNEQIFFVNKRWIRNEDLTKALYDGYHSLLFVNKHPLFIINLELDPKKIDVNVHPAKTEIKIEQKDTINNALFTAVKETLRQNNLIPEVKIEFETQQQFSFPKNYPAKNSQKYVFEPTNQTLLQVKESTAEIASDYNEIQPQLHSQLLPKLQEEVLLEETPKFPQLKLLGQIHKTFFVAETPGGMFLIDQHAAHERVLYESFMEQFLQKEVKVQNLLQGALMELSPAQKITLREHQQELQLLGFQFDSFGQNTIIIKTIPTVFGKVQPKELMFEALNLLQDGKNSLEQKREIIITMMACRAAVMAGDVLTTNEMEKILKELATKKDPYTCPHGRPTMLKTSIDELEKKFKRKG